MALIVAATRNSWGLPSLRRFVALLEAHGMTVALDASHAWPWAALAAAHIGHGVSPAVLATTTTDTGEHHVLRATWG